MYTLVNGRRTVQMKITPFSFEECCTYLSDLSDEDKALVYGIAGGTPQYLLQMSDKLSVEENIKNTYLNPTSFYIIFAVLQFLGNDSYSNL